MIENIMVGDITDRTINPRHIVIGMNTRLKDVTGIGLPFTRNISAPHPITLGSVVSFKFDTRRELHMLICHEIGKGGWKNTAQHVRYGMDYLWHSHPENRYSIVQIGTGRVGKRDGANHAEIRTAMATSFLPVNLFVFGELLEERVEARVEIPPLKAFRMWTPEKGEFPLRLAA